LTAVRATGARRAPLREAEAPAEETAATGSGPVRARQWLRARSGAAYTRSKEKCLAAAIRAIDGAIAALQGLRLQAGGEKPEEGRRSGDRARSGKRTQTGRAGTEADADDPVAIKKPRRRLRGLLVYLGVMLLGGMGSMALSYDLLARLLDRQAVELKHQEIKQSKYSKSVARLTAQLDAAQARQAQAETRLAEARAESEKKLGELETKQTAAEARLASALSARVNAVPRPDEGGSGRGTARRNQGAWTGTGDCTLGGGNVQSVLQGCIAEMGHK